MISTVTVQNFKRFKAPTAFSLKPDGVTFLAGGNNSGKSTLLQAAVGRQRSSPGGVVSASGSARPNFRQSHYLTCDTFGQIFMSVAPPEICGLSATGTRLTTRPGPDSWSLVSRSPTIVCS
jgi:ABC-type lipoprotein export system ATPase subunit